MEYLNYSINEYTFVFTASFLLLLSYFYQNWNIYKDLLSQNIILNKESILSQLNILHYNIKQNKYKLWSYQFTIFAITPILFIFNIGGNLKNLWLGLSIFLFIQFILEYYFFYLNILIEKETTNKSFNDILTSYETNKDYINLPLNTYQESEIENIKNILRKKEDIIKLSNDNKRKIYSFINGIYCDNTNLKIGMYGIRIYNENNELLELDLDDYKISIIKEFNTSYFRSFYETTTFSKIFIIGLLEPFFMSLLLLGIITIQF